MAAAIGVVGAGAISRMVHLPVLTAMPEARVAWVADAHDGRAAAVAAAFGVPHAPIASVPEAVRDCEAVLLAIPVGVRAPYLAALARHGVAVMVEKPFARTVREHDEIVAMFPPHRIACGFMRRTYASTALARRALQEGWFGRPSRIRISEGGRTTKTGVDRSYFDDPSAGGGGILLELGCHALDLVLHLTGTRDHEIVRQSMVLDGHADRRAEADVLLYPESGRRGEPIVLEYAFSWLDRQDDRVDIEFPGARLRFGTRPDAPVTLCGNTPGARETHLVPPAGGATTSNQAFYLEWRWLLESLATGVPSPVAAGTCRNVTALVEDLYAAARGRA
jgi:predicted dehydrogenase